VEELDLRAADRCVGQSNRQDTTNEVRKRGNAVHEDPETWKSIGIDEEAIFQRVRSDRIEMRREPTRKISELE